MLSRTLATIGLLLMAQLLASAKSFNTGTGAAGTTITVAHGLSAAPRAGILSWSGRTGTADGNGAGHHQRGYGAFVNNQTSGLQFRCVAGHSQDALGTAVTRAGHRADACMCAMSTTADALDGWLDVQSINGTNVVFEILDQFASDFRVDVLFLGGAVEDGELVTTTAAGAAPLEQAITLTNVSNPRLLFFFGGVNTDPPSAQVDSNLFFGAAVAASTTEQFAYGGSSNDAAATGVTLSYLRMGEAIAEINEAVTGIVNLATYERVEGAELKSVVIQWISRGRATRVFTLALTGAFAVKIGSFLTQTDTTTDMTVTASFLPRAMQFVSHTKPENVSDTATNQDKWSNGFAVSTSEQRCQAMADRQGNTNMFVSTAIEGDQIYVNMDQVTRVLQGSANLTAVASGITARMTDADPAQALVAVVMLGDANALVWKPTSPGQSMRLRR